MTTTVHIQLFGGEQDGWDRDIEIKGEAPPSPFYVWPSSANRHLMELRGTQKVAMERKLSTIAYVLMDGDQPRDSKRDPGVKEWHYRRCEASDKTVADPAV